jgi:hypothetical protein
MSALPILVVQQPPRVGCPPIKGERELGLDRRETGRSLPIGGAGRLRGRCP